MFELALDGEFFQTKFAQWVGIFLGSIMVVSTGVLPLIVVPQAVENEDRFLLNTLLAFAVGGLLGHVFLHLLPETYQMVIETGEEDGMYRIGWSVVLGMLVFLVLEKLLEISNPETDETKREEDNKKNTGYLNLLANCTDNLLHGLAVGTSFLSSFRLGVSTTFAILVHEIPHEFGDFAILLRSGYDRWSAAELQMKTASAGMVGALIAVGVEQTSGLDSLLCKILPFTAGGFLNIALVSLVPDLMQETEPIRLLAYMLSVGAGLFTMNLLAII